jgi:putative transcriptional regulator
VKKTDKGLYKRLVDGLQEGLEYVRGELDLRTTEIPERPPEMTAKDIVRLRKKFKMSQGVFARVINVSAKTVQSWEQGERTPSQASLRLLQIMAAEPKRVCQIVGIRNGNDRAED